MRASGLIRTPGAGASALSRSLALGGSITPSFGTAEEPPDLPLEGRK
jgi:hypothetical protein